MVDPHDPGWQVALDAIATSGAFRGVRLTTEMLAGNPRLAMAAAEAGLITVLYTPDGVARASRLISDLAEAVPGCTIVVTHLGCPAVEGGRVVAGWDLLDLARIPGVVVTLSGQGMFCEYPHRELEPFVGRVIEAFGVGRVMWGSNYPVLGDADAYARDLGLVRSGPWGLAQRDVTSITETSAADVFFPPTAAGRPLGAA
jgi:predicted TIM-barrel fold metal-dependent hydrolase